MLLLLSCTPTRSFFSQSVSNGCCLPSHHAWIVLNPLTPCAFRIFFFLFFLACFLGRVFNGVIICPGVSTQPASRVNRRPCSFWAGCCVNKLLRTLARPRRSPACCDGMGGYRIPVKKIHATERGRRLPPTPRDTTYSLDNARSHHAPLPGGPPASE
jgi:hypothetical protein